MAGESFYFLDGDDRYMIVLPLFHVGGTLAVYAMLARGGSIAVIEAFDTNSIWRLVRKPARLSWYCWVLWPISLPSCRPAPVIAITLLRKSLWFLFRMPLHSRSGSASTYIRYST